MTFKSRQLPGIHRAFHPNANVDEFSNFQHVKNFSKYRKKWFLSKKCFDFDFFPSNYRAFSTVMWFFLGMRANMDKHFISSIKTTIGSSAFLPTAIV